MVYGCLKLQIYGKVENTLLAFNKKLLQYPARYSYDLLIVLKEYFYFLTLHVFIPKSPYKGQKPIKLVRRKTATMASKI